MAPRLLVLTLAAIACSGDSKSDISIESDTPAQRELSVVAREFTYVAPDTVPGGFTRVVLTNDGAEPHQSVIVRLDGGHVAGELLDILGKSQIPEWAVFVGGPNASLAGASETIVELVPGNYVILCMMRSGDGIPHVHKGMVRPLTVTAAAPETAPPEPDVVVTIADSSITQSSQLLAGRRIVRVDVATTQMYELAVVRLGSGKTLEEFAGWLEQPNGRAPGTLIGGTTPHAKGIANFIVADFAPGDYGFICFLRDAAAGSAHVVPGMVRPFRIAASGP